MSENRQKTCGQNLIHATIFRRIIKILTLISAQNDVKNITDDDDDDADFFYYLSVCICMTNSALRDDDDLTIPLFELRFRLRYENEQKMEKYRAAFVPHLTLLLNAWQPYIYTDWLDCRLNECTTHGWSNSSILRKFSWPL